MVLYVIKMDCGPSNFYNGVFYDCSTRIDLGFGKDTDPLLRGYEWDGECDLTIKWLNKTEFEVIESNGKKTIFDIYDMFGDHLL